MRGRGGSDPSPTPPLGVPGFFGGQKPPPAPAKFLSFKILGVVLHSSALATKAAPPAAPRVTRDPSVAMAQPTPYDRQISFALFSAENPGVPQSGTDLDAEFNAVKVALDETQANLEIIQADDGRLAPGSVGRAQLDSSITIGFASPTPWAPNTSYTVDISTVFNDAIFYTAAETHVSGATFDPSKWRLVADLSVAAALPNGGVTEAKIAEGAVSASKIATNAVSNSKIASNAVTETKIADAAVTFAKLAIATPSAIRDAIIPAGLGPLPWSGASLPDGWDWADGGVLLANTPFPVLRQRYIDDGFPHGQDGSGNPKKPDCKGRSVFGKDNMGGSAAGRLTSAGSGVDGLTLGAAGGAEKISMTLANLIQHDHTVFPHDPQHDHGYTRGDIANIMQAAGSGTIQIQTDARTSKSSTGITLWSDGDNIGTQNKVGKTGSATPTPMVVVPPALVCNMIIKAH